MNYISDRVELECPDAVLPMSFGRIFECIAVWLLSTTGLFAGLAASMLLLPGGTVIPALGVYMLTIYLAGFGFFYPMSFMRRCVCSALTALVIYYLFLLTVLGLQSMGVLRIQG